MEQFKINYSKLYRVGGCFSVKIEEVEAIEIIKAESFIDAQDEFFELHKKEDVVIKNIEMIE